MTWNKEEVNEMQTQKIRKNHMDILWHEYTDKGGEEIPVTQASLTEKASIVKKNKKRPIINHISEFRYATSDSKVAVVSKNGKITAKGKGSCSIYVYATNGCAQKIKVVVK